MKIEVEIVSKEIIKPSSPTPDHLRHYQLSFLDQISPLVYNPLVIFFAKQSFNNNTHMISNQLKKSLSDILTRYYPLAGRVRDNKFIDCNDKGVPFLETRVRCQISNIIQNPIPSELNKLVPFQLDNVTDIAFGVQLNLFDCGGVAIGTCLSHQIADALSFFVFLNSWAATSRGQPDIVRTEFVSAALFPPINTSGFDPRIGVVKEENTVCKRFVFDAPAIEALRDKYVDHENQNRPSRVEALSAFLWSRISLMAKENKTDQHHHQRVFVVIHAVNLRPRMEPPLPEYSFGNYYRFTITFPSMDNGEDGLVQQVRDQIKNIDKDYVKKLQDGNSHLDFLKESSSRFMKGEMVSFSFTSLCKFPLYDTDFGWGKPTWVGSPALTFKNLVIFVDTKLGDGIEAYISFKVEDMAKFQVDEELLAYCNEV
ncbi:Vinorine synthase-like [Quillaja saponaria]|uniref:Vinorine synthase-like n=1 Tax=Quillaja saponaria TaxID=32244 RepID=A0AAD7KTF2_QUISA|nr:Vinorine synthase-like [Quillaja saponaria]